MAVGASLEASIRGDIIRGIYPPASRLRMDDLTNRFEVGFSPIREALCRLLGEGFVELEPNRGFRVAPLSKEDLLDIALTRSTVELAALRLSIERGDDAWESALMSAMHQYRRKSIDPFASEQSLQAWEQAHEALHAALIGACGSPRLLALQKRLQDQHLRYRRLIVTPENTTTPHVEEHEQLVRSAIDRDLDATMAKMKDHLMITVNVLNKVEF